MLDSSWDCEAALRFDRRKDPIDTNTEFTQEEWDDFYTTANTEMFHGLAFTPQGLMGPAYEDTSNTVPGRCPFDAEDTRPFVTATGERTMTDNVVGSIVGILAGMSEQKSKDGKHEFMLVRVLDPKTGTRFMGSAWREEADTVRNLNKGDSVRVLYTSREVPNTTKGEAPKVFHNIEMIDTVAEAV